MGNALFPNFARPTDVVGMRPDGLYGVRPSRRKVAERLLAASLACLLVGTIASGRYGVFDEAPMLATMHVTGYSTGVGLAAAAVLQFRSALARRAAVAIALGYPTFKVCRVIVDSDLRGMLLEITVGTGLVLSLLSIAYAGRSTRSLSVSVVTPDLLKLRAGTLSRWTFAFVVALGLQTGLAALFHDWPDALGPALFSTLWPGLMFMFPLAQLQAGLVARRLSGRRRLSPLPNSQRAADG